MTDDEIINQVLSGNKDHYRTIVDKYQPMVFRTCMGFLHYKEEAEDLTQDVFIQAYQNLGRFKGESSFSTWLYRIAINTSLNRVRSTQKNFIMQRIESFRDTEKRWILQVPVRDNENPESIMILDEHREWLKKALNSLPENQRTAIVLSKYDDLSQKEIAGIMNTTEGAVEALIQRAKKNLREKLSHFSKKNKK